MDVARAGLWNNILYVWRRGITMLYSPVDRTIISIKIKWSYPPLLRGSKKSIHIDRNTIQYVRTINIIFRLEIRNDWDRAELSTFSCTSSESNDLLAQRGQDETQDFDHVLLPPVNIVGVSLNFLWSHLNDKKKKYNFCTFRP